jgi:hypothetical protein
MTVMASSVTLCFLALYTGSSKSEWAGIDFDIHQALANLAWVYLLAHSRLAIVHHHAQNLNLSEMWSPRRMGAGGLRTGVNSGEKTAETCGSPCPLQNSNWRSPSDWLNHPPRTTWLLWCITCPLTCCRLFRSTACEFGQAVRDTGLQP